MGCRCNEGKTNFQVVLKDGKVAFTSTSKTAAEGVLKRYPGATLREAATAKKAG